MDCPKLIRMLVAVRKRYKFNSSLLAECLVGNLFVLQYQREDTGEICLCMYIDVAKCPRIPHVDSFDSVEICILLQKTWL